MAVTCTYVTQLSSTSDLTTYTYSAASIGTAAATRVVTLGVEGRSSGTPNSAISTITIGGVSAALRGSSWVSGRLVAEMWSAVVPTGTTGDIVITYGEAQTHSSVGIWAVYDAVATPTGTDGGTGSGADISLTALTVPTDGCGIFNWVSGNNAACTWTNATERFDAEMEGGSFRHSGSDTTTVGTNTITADGATAVQALMGVAFGPAKILSAGGGSYALTGTAATPKHGWKTTAAAGSMALSGTAATPKHGWKIAAAAGSMSLSGTAAGTLHGWKLAAGADSYSLTGNDVTLTISADKTIAADAGSMSLSGTAASPLHGWKLAAGDGSMALNGVSASLLHGWKVAAGAGSMALNGTDATFRRTYVLAAGGGSYSVSGTAASPEQGYKLTAGAGSMLMSGTDADLITSLQLAAGAGSMAVNGTAASPEKGWRITSQTNRDTPFELIGSTVIMIKGGHFVALPADPGAYRRLVRRIDKNYDRGRAEEPEYEFGDRVFYGRTSRRGPYE